MQLNGITIDDSFAEAFPMKATRLVITAHNTTWAMHAAVATTGFATSVIACGCEAGIERELGPDETPDGRPGLALLLFAMSSKELGKQIAMHIAAAFPQALSAADLDPVVLERERKIALEKAIEEAAKSGKQIPEDILAKRADGAAAKFAKDNALLSQVFVMDNKTPVAQVVEQAGKAAGTKIVLKDYVRFQLGEGIEKEVSDFAAEVAAGEHGIEVAEEEDAFALGAFVLGDEVAGAAGGGGEGDEAVGEAEGGELGAVEIGELADAGEVLGGAVDLDGGLEVAVEIAGLGFGGSDDFFLGGI